MIAADAASSPPGHDHIVAPVTPGRSTRRDLLIIAALALSVILAFWLGRIILVLIAAMFVAYVIAPLVDVAQQPVSLRGRSRRLPRVAAVALVYLLLAGSVGAVAVILW